MTVTSMGARVAPRLPSVIVGVGDGLLRTRVLDRAVAEARRRDRTVRVVHADGPATPRHCRTATPASGPRAT